MNNLHIELTGDRRQYAPGAEITGQVAWELATAPAALELRLFWFTRGKGTTDTEIVQTVRFDYPRPADRREFRVRLPAAPFSFSGKLISLLWALELVALPSNAATRTEFTISPTGEEILLESTR
jgi:hypothetical protein